MRESIFKYAQTLVVKANLINCSGKVETEKNIEEMEMKLQITLPYVLKEIYLTLPITGLMTSYNKNVEELDWQYYIMEWMNCKNIISEMTETETGIQMGNKGFLAIGMDVLGGGDYYYIDLKDDKLPLYQCFHDDMSLEKMSDSLEEVLKKAHIN